MIVNTINKKYVTKHNQQKQIFQKDWKPSITTSTLIIGIQLRGKKDNAIIAQIIIHVRQGFQQVYMYI